MEVTSLEIFGYIGALFIGLVLGLIGGGGSILTVPILVYFMGLSPVIATAYSLFVVGSASLVGTVRNLPKKLVDFKTAFLFAVPAFSAVYVSRRFLIQAIPEVIISIGSLELSKSMAIMLFFALLMLLASFSMIKNRAEQLSKSTGSKHTYWLILIGVIVGFLTGMVGAGGGFLIIPALVLFAKIPMKKAVATSLLIIAINSLIGFIGDVQNIEINWYFLLVFTAISVIGIFIGVKFNHWIDGKKLRKGFGWFVLIMAIYIILKELT